MPQRSGSAFPWAVVLLMTCAAVVSYVLLRPPERRTVVVESADVGAGPPEERPERKHEVSLPGHWAPEDVAPRPAPPVPIINVHEHVSHPALLPAMFAAFDAVGIRRTLALGAPRYTFELGDAGFEGHHANNATLLEASRASAQLDTFVAVKPDEPDTLNRLREEIAQGAAGVKLFAGHGALDGQKRPFHSMPLDDPRLLAVYRLLEAENLPVVLHVNINRFGVEFERVLKAHPKLRVNCPHFCLSVSRPERIRAMLERYDNLWMDISFGYIQFQAEGFARVDAAQPELRQLFLDHPDRFLFGTDLVITNAAEKSTEWMTVHAQAYRDLLERAELTFYALKGESPLRGLDLPREVLERVYSDNAVHWLTGSEVTKDRAPSEPATRSAEPPADP